VTASPQRCKHPHFVYRLGVGRRTNQHYDDQNRNPSPKTVDDRTGAAEHLAGLTQKISSKEVTEALVTDVTSLLDSPDDSVRYWVATAPGNLGPAAKAAVPKLEEVLPKADCINGAITSASGIRYALIKRG
jgi:hypothetical protein